MQILDWILVALIALAVILAAAKTVRDAKNGKGCMSGCGGCAGCSGCSECPGRGPGASGKNSEGYADSGRTSARPRRCGESTVNSTESSAGLPCSGEEGDIGL